jgi:hypothetical protein
MKYFLTRMFKHEPELSWPLSKEGFVSIGFGDFIRDSSTIESIRNDPSLQNLKKIANLRWGKSPKTLSNLARFLTIQKDDFVIVPSWGSFYYAKVLESWKPLSEVSSELNTIFEKLGKKHDQYDIGFVVRVEWQKRKDGNDEIGRNEFADKALTSRLKARQTCLDISDLEQSIKSAWNCFNDNVALNPNAYLLDSMSNDLYKILTMPNSPLTPHKFETLIKELMHRMDATTVETPAITGEGDADIVATFENIKHIIYIQAKFYENGTKASNWAVKQISDFSNRQDVSAIEDYSTAFWVISSAEDFSEDAKSLAKKENVRLLAGKDLARLLLQTGLGSGL